MEIKSPTLGRRVWMSGASGRTVLRAFAPRTGPCRALRAPERAVPREPARPGSGAQSRCSRTVIRPPPAAPVSCYGQPPGPKSAVAARCRESLTASHPARTTQHARGCVTRPRPPRQALPAARRRPQGRGPQSSKATANSSPLLNWLKEIASDSNH